MITYILLVVFSLISAISKAIEDICSESSFYESKLVKKYNFNPEFWYKSLSSKNKWKNGDKTQGEKFWGSSRWFVMFTDGWHIMDAIRNVSFVVVGVCSSTIWVALLSLIVILSTFEFLYTYLKK